MACGGAGVTDGLAHRFWSKVDTSGGPDACWPWLGTICPDGYGRVKVDGRSLGAHVVAYDLTRGPRRQGVYVLHHCDAPPCVNPRHLFTGTQAANLRDMKGKGRGNWPGQQGECHPSVKLTERQVRDIRQRAAAGEPQSSLGGRFNITQTNVSLIVRRRTWRHVA